MEMEGVVSRDGTKISLRRTGIGPPLLLIHGTTADHSRWDAISPPFEDIFSVYAMDRRGRGESGDAPPYALEREAEDVAAVVDGIGEPTAVLGHSYGALVGLEASLLTSGVSRLVLYEPPILLGDADPHPADVPERMARFIQEGALEEALLVFFREVVGMPEHELASYRKLPAWPVRIRLTPTILREMEAERSYRFDPERFSRLQVPTLLLLGGDSPALFREALEAVDSALPESQIRTLPGQQHIAMDTAPELFLRESLAFLHGQKAVEAESPPLRRGPPPAAT